MPGMPAVLTPKTAAIIRGNSLYDIVYGPSWMQAELAAQAEGGKLLSIEENEEKTFIEKWLKALYPENSIGTEQYLRTGYQVASSGSPNSLWIGVSFDYNKQGFTWDSGEPFYGFLSQNSLLVGDLTLYPRLDRRYFNDYMTGNYYRDGSAVIGARSMNVTSVLWPSIGIAEIPLSLTIAFLGATQEGADEFTTSIHLKSSGNLAEGAQVWWKVTGITADDLVSGALTGTGNITNGKLDIQHSLKADADTGEKFEVSVFSDSSLTADTQIGSTQRVAIQESRTIFTASDAQALMEMQGSRVVIPEGYTRIDDQAFAGAPVTSVVLPSTLQTIGNQAFIDSGLADIVIPEGVQSIGWYAFLRTNLQSVTIPSSVTFIGNRAFDAAIHNIALSGTRDNSLLVACGTNVVIDGVSFGNDTGRIEFVDLGFGSDTATLSDEVTPDVQMTIAGGDGTDDLNLSSAVNTVVLSQSGAGSATSTGNAVSTAFSGFEIIRLGVGSDNSDLDLNGTTALTTKRQLRLEGGLGNDLITLRLNAQERQNLITIGQLVALQSYISNPTGQTLTISLLEVDLVLAGFESALLITPNNAPTGTPTLSGTLKTGQVITIDKTPIQDADNLTGYTPTYNYTFEVSNDNGTTWTKLTSADATDNNSTYTLTTAEVGKKVRGVVSYLDGYGTIEAVPTTSSSLIQSGNNAPTNLTLTSSGINENSAAGTVIGTLAATDPDADSSFTYALAAGTGGNDADNALVEIVGSQIRVKSGAPIDFETNPLLNLNIQVTDNGGLTFSKAVTAAVLNVNEAPSNLTASATTFNENIVAGSVVATLGTTDPDVGNTFTYALVAGAGSTDNAAFSISGNQLKINASPNFESKSSYSIRVQTKDQGGLFFEKSFTFGVNDLIEKVTSSASTVLAPDKDILELTGSRNIFGTGNDRDNTITGNSGRNRITGGLGKDILTGGLGQDVFFYAGRNESLLGRFDVIKDFSAGETIACGFDVEGDAIIAPRGIIDSLVESSIKGLLTETVFEANSVDAFKVIGISGCFVAINDSNNGFQAGTDSIIHLLNYDISASNPVVII